VNKAIESGATALTIAGGEYHFGSNNFQIENANMLQIMSLAPVALWFSGHAGVNSSTPTAMVATARCRWQ
jgi:hypothetical protein